MRTMGMRHPVVVGVDGTAAGETAVLYGLQEAARNRCGLRLVHAYAETIPMAPMLSVFSGPILHETADRVMSHAVHALDDLPDSHVPLDVVVRRESPVHALLDAAADARMIVLGQRQEGPPRLSTCSTGVSMAAHASCPVVRVPAYWKPDVSFGKVVVGVDGSHGSEGALRAAFQAASTRNAALVVIHAWRPPEYYFDGTGAYAQMVEEWESSVRLTVSEVLAGWRERYPEVEVTVQVELAHPADALVTASREADLLVLGRRGAGWGLRLPVGSIARTLLSRSHCPVEVCPTASRVSRSGQQKAPGGRSFLLPTY